MLGKRKVIEVDEQWLQVVLAQYENRPVQEVVVQLDPKQVISNKEINPLFICEICCMVSWEMVECKECAKIFCR